MDESVPVKNGANSQKGDANVSHVVRIDPQVSRHVVPRDKRSLEGSSSSDISTTSFKRWHKHVQSEHIRMRRSSFQLWKCCDKVFRPCRWIDSIGYDTKICKCCLTFRTFKTWGTIIIIALYFYLFMYSILKEQVLPGGTIFFLFFLFVSSYLCGFSLILVGLPPMMGHLAIGIIMAQLPRTMIPERDDATVERITEISEKILLVLALIRAGLLLDLSRIKRQLTYILQLGFIPFIFEFAAVWCVAHFLLSLSWDWSAQQGTVISVVSLANITTITQKNKIAGYGEDKDLGTVLIAASVLNVIFGLFFYMMCITYIVPGSGSDASVWIIFLILLKGWFIGLLAGGASGLLAAFFPDKRNTEAAALRIIVIGIGSFSMTNVFSESRMIAAGVLCCLTFCITATNMWEEIGWHKDNNPVQYFYTIAYYSGQPVVLSLLGFSMDFKHSDKKQIGMAVAVICAGLVIRGVATCITINSKKYETTLKEKVFICVAWFSKGTFQALLASQIKYIVILNSEYLEETILAEYLDNAALVEETTIISILLTTPLACFFLTIMSPVLLNKEETPMDPDFIDGPPRKRSSIKHTFGRFSMSE